VHKPSCENLFHAGVIVRTGYRLYFELPVIAPLWFPFFINNHRTHIGKPADIGNVEGFHAMDIFKLKQSGYLADRSYGASFLPFNALFVLAQDKLRILCRQFHQLFLISFSWNAQINSAAFSCAEPFFQNFDIVYLFLKHQFLRNIRRSRIELLYKIQQNLSIVTARHMGHVKMLPPD